MNEDRVVPFKLSEEIIKTLDLLKESPAFAMSRGGRELFHTNFMAFILEQTTIDSNVEEYGQRIKKNLLTQIFGEQNIPKNVKVFREKLNLDLIIIPIDDIPKLFEEQENNSSSSNIIDKELKVVVIEAKLKSIPTTQQLKKYSDTLKGKITIDLYEGDDNSILIINKEKRTLTIKCGKKITNTYVYNNILYDCFLLAPKAFELQELASESSPKLDWKNLNWNFLFKNLESVWGETNDDSTKKLSIFIQDYIESTNNVLNLISLVIKFTEEFIEAESKISMSSLCQFTMHDSFKRLKLHDLVGKVVYEFLAKTIYDLLPETEHQLSFKAFLSNSTPGFEIEFTHSWEKDEIGLGVQLQGCDYRHYIKRNFSNEVKSLEACADKYKHWLSTDNNSGVRNTPQYKKFNKDRFLYLSRDACNLNFSQLVAAFKSSLIESETGNSTASELINCEIFRNDLFATDFK